MATTDLGKWMITNGGNYSPEATYEQLTMVMYDNSTYITLKTVTGITPTNDGINYILMAQGFDATALDSIEANDTSGLLGESGNTVSAQSLIDYLADAVATKLLKKTDIATTIENSTDTVPASSLLYQLNSDMGGMKFFTDISSLGLERDTATPNSVIDAMPYRSALVVSSSVFTNPAWNFPGGRYTLEIISVTGGRAIISLYGKTPTEADYRMFLNNENNYPSGKWTKIISNADFAPLTYNDTPGDTIQDLIKAKAKIIAQNMSGNICGMLPGGWQGQQFGFTIFEKANNIITLIIIMQFDVYTAYYNSSTDTVSSIKKITTTSV